MSDVHTEVRPRNLKHATRSQMLGMSVAGTPQWIEQVLRGFPFKTLIRFQHATGMPLGEITDWINIPPRTLLRRKSSGRLTSDESERLLRAARIFESSIRLFEGDVEAARQWLGKPNVELGGATPLAYARTEVGAWEVEDLIGRLEYGVFT